MKILNVKQHPNWDNAILITFKNGTTKCVPKTDYYIGNKEIKNST